MSNGVFKEADTSINVLSKPIAITKDLPGISGGKIGDACTLAISATGTLPFKFQWFKNDTAIAGKTDSLYSINSISLSDSGDYHCVVSDNFGRVQPCRKTVFIVKPLLSPNPPKGLRIAGIDGGSLRIIWNSVDSADSYKIYRDTTDSGNTRFLAIVSDTTALVEHKSQACKIWVTTMRNNLESMPSEIVSYNPDEAVLYPPTDLKAVQVNDSTVLVTWNSVVTASGYIVFRNTTSDTSGFKAIDTTADTALFVNSRLDSAWYQVLAYNSTLISQRSPSVKIVMPSDTVVPPPSVTECRIIEPGASINEKLLEIYASELHQGTLCPQSGKYDANTIEVIGNLQVLIR
jgi:hypothetical protein